jgi:hypothetical protein
MLPAIFLAALVSLPGVSHHYDPGFEHIRSARHDLPGLIADIATRSPTFATLLEQLDRTNVVVYVQFVTNLPIERHGQLHFIGASETFRFVRVQIKAGLPFDQLAASLGHELYHGLEIGQHPEVRCGETMGALYRRIGKVRPPRGYETSEAGKTGRKIREEVIGS